jgi:hypothetical protein
MALPSRGDYESARAPEQEDTSKYPPEMVAFFAKNGIPLPAAPGEQGSNRLLLLGIDEAVAQSPVMLRAGAPRERIGLGAGGASYGWPEMSTLVDALEDFWDLSDDALIDIQQRLWRAGFYGSGDQPAYGAMDSRTFEAYRDAVVLAARSGRPLLTDILDPKNEPAVTADPVTNREDIRVLLERVAPEAIGRKLSGEEMERAVAAWHAREREPVAGEEPMSAEAQVDLALSEVAPGEEEAQDFGERANQFFQLLGSPVGG